MPPRPAPLPPADARSIAALAFLAEPMHRRWISWRYELVKDKWSKIPYQLDGRKAATDRPDTWTEYQPVYAAAERHIFDGVGLVLTGLPGELFAAIDLDDVRTPDGTLLPWAQALIERCSSYTEITPSQCGVRILGTAGDIGTMHTRIAHPAGGSAELFVNCTRYITVSGNMIRTGWHDLSNAISELAKLRPTGGGNGQQHTTTIRLDLLSPTVVDLITRGEVLGTTVKHRGQQFFHVVRYLKKAGFEPDASLELLAAHPEGVAGKYAGRLEREFSRAWDKGEAPDQDNPQRPSVPAPLPWIYRDPTQMRPRPWLLGTMLLRGYCTVLSSQGGVGKTSLAILACLAVITGRRDLLNMHSFVQGPTWYLTLEDDIEELERRIAAAIIEHNVNADTVDGQLYVNHPNLTLLTTDPRTQAALLTDDLDALIAQIREHDFRLVVIDPLIKAHHANENNNEHMNALVTAGNHIAELTGAALLLPHHFRKGGNSDGTRDASRGASALIDGARLALNLLPMTAPEAQELNLDDAERYVRLVNAKTNMAPKGDLGWLELTPVQLGNTTTHPAYPAGDTVQTLKPWQPPTLFADLSHDILSAIFADLGADNANHSPSKHASNWAGNVVRRHANKSSRQAATIIETWITNAVLAIEEVTTDGRKNRRRVVLNQYKAEQILRQTEPAPGSDY